MVLCASRPEASAVARYEEAAARQGCTCRVVADAGEVGDLGGVEGVVAVGPEDGRCAAAVAARLTLRWHRPEAVALAGDRLQWLGRLTAAGIAVPRFAVVEAATGDGVERLAGVPVPWHVTGGVTGRQAIVRGLDDLRALAEAWSARGNGPSRAGAGDGDDADEALVVEATVSGPAWGAVGLLDAGALRIVGTFATANAGADREGAWVVTAPSGLARTDEAHLAGVVARACAALGLRDGPIVAEVRQVGQYPCLMALQPGSLEAARADVLALVGPGGRPVSLEDVVVRHARGLSLEGYALEGRPRTVEVQV